MPPILKNFLSFIGDIVETIIIALAIFLVVYIFLVQPHRVSGDSMKPNFFDGELILTDKLSYRLGKPERGDVIVFKAPTDQKKDFIKRIIGLPGETISIDQGAVFINEEKLDEPYLPPTIHTSGGSSLSNNVSIEIPANSYFVLGDNRSHSFDSREWGPLTKENIIGRAWLIYWPIQKINFIPRVQYP